jgi:hypothetical protein
VILFGVQRKCRSHAFGAGRDCAQIIAKTDIWRKMILRNIFRSVTACGGIPNGNDGQWLQDR